MSPTVGIEFHADPLPELVCTLGGQGIVCSIADHNGFLYVYVEGAGADAELNPRDDSLEQLLCMLDREPISEIQGMLGRCDIGHWLEIGGRPLQFAGCSRRTLLDRVIEALPGYRRVERVL